MSKIKFLLPVLSVSFLALSCGKTSSSLSAQPSASPSVSVSSSEEEEPASSDESKTLFTVHLKDEAGNPMSGYMVQWCTTTNCFIPVKSDAEGTATLSLDSAGTYTVHVKTASLGALTDYAYNPNLTQDKDHPTLDITLYSYASLSDGKITSEGIYLLSLAKDGEKAVLEVPLSLPEGNYSIESWANQNPADGDVYDPKVTIGDLSDDNSGTGKNFLLNFDSSATLLHVEADAAFDLPVKVTKL